VRLSSGTARPDETAEHGALAGTVIDAATGVGVRGATLDFAHAGRMIRVTAADDGRFVFLPPRPGAYVLGIVAADDYFPFAPEWGTSPIAFRAAAGVRVEGVVLHLTPIARYGGLVVDAAGEPVAGADVRLLGAHAELAILPLETTYVTDADGTFRCAAPDDAIFEATHAEKGRGRAAIDLGAQASGRFVIRLDRRADAAQADARIAGTVIGPDEAPLPDALVRAVIELDNPAAPHARLHPFAQSVTAADGTFTLAGLDPGRYRVSADAEGHARGAISGVAAGARDVVVRLDEERLLRGVVVDPESGAPVVAATVVVERARSALMREVVATASTFGADGRFEVRGLASDTYAVTATAHGYASSTEDGVVVGSTGAPPDITIALRRGGAVAGVVTSSERGAPIAGARVSLEGRLGGGGTSAVPLLRDATSDASGRFEITGVPPGEQSLFVAARDHHARLLSGLFVAEGARIEVEVDLTKTEPGETPRIELAGIGVVIATREDELVIGRVVEGGGAAEAGLGEGDAILAVDGVPVTELGFEGSVARLRGPEGSAVVLTIRRTADDGRDATTDVRVVRRRIRA
jgi:hypothetical protein